jgi:hypothetical protein
MAQEWQWPKSVFLTGISKVMTTKHFPLFNALTWVLGITLSQGRSEKRLCRTDSDDVTDVPHRNPQWVQLITTLWWFTLPYQCQLEKRGRRKLTQPLTLDRHYEIFLPPVPARPSPLPTTDPCLRSQSVNSTCLDFRNLPRVGNSL